MLLVWVCTAGADVYVHFDEVAAGTPLSAHYAPTHGLSLIGLGDRGPFEVIADAPCNGNLSQPNVLSLRPLAECPELNDLEGFFELSFNSEQAFVSIRALHTIAGTVSYLAAYSGPDAGDFLDQVFGDFDLVDVPQTLRIDRKPEEAQIRRVRFGVFNQDNRVAAFDDLRFEKLPVAAFHQRWGTVKARW